MGIYTLKSEDNYKTAYDKRAKIRTKDGVDDILITQEWIYKQYDEEEYPDMKDFFIPKTSMLLSYYVLDEDVEYQVENGAKYIYIKTNEDKITIAKVLHYDNNIITIIEQQKKTENAILIRKFYSKVDNLPAMALAYIPMEKEAMDRSELLPL